MSFNRQSRLSRLLLSTTVVAFSMTVLWHVCSEKVIQVIPASLTATSGSDEQSSHSKLSEPFIPNVVHFVYILDDPDKELVFQFGQFLSIYASWLYWRPSTIYLHTDASDEMIARLRSGNSGKWGKLVMDLPGLSVTPASVPTHAGNGAKIDLAEHKSDFVRVKAVKQYGGIYIDFDAHPLRDIALLRNSGFNAIGGRQHGGDVMSGTFMSKKEGKMITLWADGMHRLFDGGWTTHSNGVITLVGERLVADPGEMLIMEREAFAPGSWDSWDSQALFVVHNDTESVLDGFSFGDSLPSFDETPDDVLGPSKDPSWATDWSRTYILHAFKGDSITNPPYGFHDGITPRYVLERRSNFARAVYPAVKAMYEGGILQADDLVSS